MFATKKKTKTRPVVVNPKSATKIHQSIVFKHAKSARLVFDGNNLLGIILYDETGRKLIGIKSVGAELSVDLVNDIELPPAIY